MNRCSFFIKNKALFGSYPSQEAVNELEGEGVRYFIDVTCPGEKKITKYNTKYMYLNYPIYDHKIPNDWKSFATLILTICAIIKNLPENEKIYIHCKGGHGRSGIVVACVLVNFFNISVKKALVLTNKYHGRRKEMREKWRKIGSPQTYMQKNFVMKFFDPLFFDSGHSMFSMDTQHVVNVDGIGEYKTAKDAYVAGKIMFANDKNWESIKCNVMFTILYCKFKQHTNLKSCLMDTGLRNLIYNEKKEEYWGTNGMIGKNMLGKLLVKVRNKLALEDN